MANPIRPEDLPVVPSLGAGDAFIVDTGDGVYKATPVEIVEAGGAATLAGLAADDGSLIKASASLTVKQWVASLLASAGSTLVGFIQAGTDAVTRTVQDKLRDVVSVKDFGASPALSAAANNTAIQLGIAAAIAGGFDLDIGNTGTFQITGLLIDAATGFTLRGSGARLATTTNSPAVKVQNSSNVVLDGLYITGNAGATNNNQAGVFFDSTAYCTVRNCRIENVSVGFYANNTTRGYPLTGSFQVPSLATGNIIRNCRRGAYFRDGGIANTYGEYWQFQQNLVTDCAYAGIWCEAGNTSIIGNTVNGNILGVVLFSLGTSNGDHGICSLNTINHNAVVGLYVGSNLRSWTIVGNNIWATLGGLSGTDTLFNYFGGTNQGYAFGVYLDNVQDVTFNDNVVARNQFNMATKTVIRSVIKSNQFLTDPASTVANTWDYTAGGAFYPIGNFFGPNVYDGTWTDTVTFPHNGNFNRWTKIGASGAPAFANGWLNYGGGFPDAAFSKDGHGVVHLAGLIKTGTVNTAAFTLPADFRPFDGIKSYATLSNSAMGGVQIAPTGEVNIVTPSSSAYTALDALSFATS